MEREYERTKWWLAMALANTPRWRIGVGLDFGAAAARILAEQRP